MERPYQKISTVKLINHLSYINKFVASAKKKIGREGGWIAREANLKEIDKAKKEKEAIEKELDLRI